MKKQIITASAISLAILAGSFTTVAIKNANATIPAEDNLLALETTELSSAAIKLEPVKIATKHETVYAVTDNNGNINKSFVGSTLNTSTITLPISVNIKYYLDGTEISATELAGKSGHIRIEYHYTSTKTYQSKLIPFVAITGLNLDDAKFTNLKLENGRVVSEERGLTIIGYSFVGLNENLGTDFLPSHFAFEADVKEFKLDTTYTIATNAVFADIDTTKLTSIDSLINSINQLGSGFNQIISGASQLNDGLGELFAGITTLKSKVDTITDKILTVTTDAETAIADFNEIVNAGREIVKSVPTTSDFINEELEAYAAEHNLPEELVDKLEDLIAVKYDKAYSKFATRVSEIDTAITDGTNLVSSYITKIKSGTTELRNGVSALADGANQLYNGSTQLKDGLLTFKSQGINRLVNFANQDLSNFVLNLRKTIDAANSYRSYDNSSAESVKFVFKTPSIK